MYDKEKWLRAADFHGHQCPGLAIGYKAVEAALAKRPAGAAQDEEIVCVTENDTCAADAVQALRRLQRWVRANGTAIKAPRHILFNAQMAASQLKGAKSS